MFKGKHPAPWFSFPFERRAWEPFFDNPPPGDDRKDPPAKTFTQAELDAIVQRRLGEQKESLKGDADFLKDITDKVKNDLTAAAAADKKRKEGEFESLTGDILAMKDGVIPEDSPLGIAIKTLHGRNASYETSFRSQVDKRLESMGSDIKDLMPEGMSPDKQLEWLDKAEAKFKSSPAGAQGQPGSRVPSNGHKDPVPLGDKTPTVDDVVKEMRGLSIYRSR